MSTGEKWLGDARKTVFQKIMAYDDLAYLLYANENANENLETEADIISEYNKNFDNYAEELHKTLKNDTTKPKTTAEVAVIAAYEKLHPTKAK